MITDVKNLGKEPELPIGEEKSRGLIAIPGRKYSCLNVNADDLKWLQKHSFSASVIIRILIKRYRKAVINKQSFIPINDFHLEMDCI
jgi:hypothetical protein